MPAFQGSFEPTLARRLADCLVCCGDLLQLATYRLPEAQGCDKEMWVS
jgi:hypothetical protein